MPAIQQKAEIDVRAPAAAAFAIVAGDVLKTEDDRDAMVGHRPIHAGPLRKGFRWQQTVVHERLVCRTDWVVTAVEEPRLLEKVFGSPQSRSLDVSLRKRLAYVQFTAERQS